MELKEIQDNVIKVEKVKWRSLEFLQHEGFKDVNKPTMEKLKKSLVENGYMQPAFVWQNGDKLYCLDGYHRRIALSELAEEGHNVPEELTGLFVHCKDKKHAAKMVLVYSSIYANVTDEGLYQFSHDYNINFDDIKLEIDIPKLDLDKYEAGYVTDEEYNEDEDIVPDPPVEPKAKLGDLYLLGGRHRLLCGDCTDKDSLKRFLDGNNIDIVLTDPPYGINIVKVHGATVGGSKPVTMKGKLDCEGGPTPFGGVKNKTGTVGARGMVDANEYFPIEGDDRPFDPQHIIDNFQCHKILFGANHYASKLTDSRCWIVWNKDVYGHFAPIELAWTDFDKLPKLYTHVWSGLRREGQRNEELTNRVHPTQKPVGLFKQILNDFSEEKQNIWDGYGGSGTTLIACEQTNRICYMMEISPHYIDVIIERYKTLTGKEVELIESVED